MDFNKTVNFRSSNIAWKSKNFVKMRKLISRLCCASKAMKYEGFSVDKTFLVMGNLVFWKVFQPEIRGIAVARTTKNVKILKRAQKESKLSTF